jgi:hypothetical protein
MLILTCTKFGQLTPSPQRAYRYGQTTITFRRRASDGSFHL